MAPFRPDPTDLPHVDPSAAMLTAAMLAAAMQRGEIRTAFQPQVALATGALTGVEALSRWTDAAGGAIAPDRFIRVAEQAGLIGRLSQSVLRDSLAAAALLRRHHPAATVAVNMSPALLDDPGLPDAIAGHLDAAGLPGAALVIEITEGQPFADPERAVEVLGILRRRGVGCAMDDFGTGFATLPALLRMPFSELKIDRSFVARVVDLPEAERLVRATIRLAQALGLRVVAEGIETAAVEAMLREAGCDAGQGFLYGEAMSIEAVLSRWPGNAPSSTTG